MIPADSGASCESAETPAPSGAVTVCHFPADGERLEPGREELRPARPKRGYVAKGECHDKRSCYLMGCENLGCLAHHTRYVKQDRARRLELGVISHGPVGYDCGCRCDACEPARARKYKREALAEIARLTRGRAS